MDKTVLVIKTDMMLKRRTLDELYTNICNQVKCGVVILPPWFDAEVIQVPENVEIHIESSGEVLKGENL